MNRAFIPLLTLLAGCGNLSQEDASEQIAEHSCDRAERCERIGEGRTYVDRDDCEAREFAYWSARLPEPKCDGNIRAEDLQVCLDRIDRTACDDPGGELGPFGLECTQTIVCYGDDDSGF